MTLVSDDEVEGLDRNIRIVADRRQFIVFPLPGLEGGGLFLLRIDILAAEHGIKPLDRRDDHLGVRIDPV